VDAFTLDEEKGERFVAVTNPVPDLPANLRRGDNRYTNSAVVLDVRTGKLLWFQQTVPNDSHDWDLTQETLIAARMRNVVAVSLSSVVCTLRSATELYLHSGASIPGRVCSSGRRSP
jgi:glucose dehydrogenase